jgi:hypothetical protein
VLPPRLVLRADVPANAALGTGIDALIQAGGRWVNVTDSQRRVAGILSAGAIVGSCRHALQASARTLAGAPMSAAFADALAAPGTAAALRHLARGTGREALPAP